MRSRGDGKPPPADATRSLGYADEHPRDGQQSTPALADRLWLPTLVALCELPRAAPTPDHRHRLRPAGGSFFCPNQAQRSSALTRTTEVINWLAPKKEQPHRPENAQPRHSAINAPAKSPQNTRHVSDYEKSGLAEPEEAGDVWGEGAFQRWCAHEECAFSGGAAEAVRTGIGAGDSGGLG